MIPPLTTTEITRARALLRKYGYLPCLIEAVAMYKRQQHPNQPSSLRLSPQGALSGLQPISREGDFDPMGIGDNRL